MKLQTLKSLIEIEFERADNQYKLKSAIDRLLDLYEADNILEKNNGCVIDSSGIGVTNSSGVNWKNPFDV